MNNKLQKEILMVLNTAENFISVKYIKTKIKSEALGIEVNKQLYFLLDEEAIVKYEDRLSFSEDSDFRLTEWGELRVKGGYKKWWYWLIYRNHNLAVVISIMALLFSSYPFIYKLIKLFVSTFQK